MIKQTLAMHTNEVMAKNIAALGVAELEGSLVCSINIEGILAGQRGAEGAYTTVIISGIRKQGKV